MKKLFLLYLLAGSLASCTPSGKENEGKQNSDKVEQNYEELVKQIAGNTKSTLSKNLSESIAEGGSARAVEFCNTRANQITDSLSGANKAIIKRVSDKPRNPENSANDEELTLMNEWKKAMAAGEKIQPRFVETGDKVTGYFSIETNAMCLQCHGTPGKTISGETLEKINSLYPQDRATGYGENELRGLLVVEVQKN